MPYRYPVPTFQPSVGTLPRLLSVAVAADVNLSATAGTATAAGGTVSLSVTYTAAAGVATAGGSTTTLTHTSTAAGGVATASGSSTSLSIAYLASSGVATAGGGSVVFTKAIELSVAGGTATAGGGTVALAGTWTAETGVATASGGIVTLAATYLAVAGVATAGGGTVNFTAENPPVNLSATTGVATAGGGTVALAVTLRVNGRHGVDFNGTTAYGQAADSASLQVETNNAFSWALWVKLDSYNNNNLPRLWEKRSQYVAIMGDSGNGKYRQIALEIVDTGGVAHEYWGRVDMDAGVWTHIAGAFDGATDICRMWVNGVEDTVDEIHPGGPWGGTLQSTSGVDFYLARRRTDQLRNLDGALSDVRLWDRALSPAEIVDAYNGTVASSGLIADWDLDEGAGTTALDDSGNGNTVTLTNPVWLPPQAAATGGTAALAFTYTASAGIATAAGGTVDFSQTAGFLAADGVATATGGTTSLTFVYATTGGLATGVGGDVFAAIGTPPVTHPTTGGSFDDTVTGGTVSATRRGGAVVTYARGGRVDEPSRGGSVDEPKRGGEIDLPGGPELGGVFDQTATGGVVVERQRGGVVFVKRRGGVVAERQRGGIYDQGATGGIVDERRRGGVFDELDTGGDFDAPSRGGVLELVSTGGDVL